MVNSSFVPDLESALYRHEVRQVKAGVAQSRRRRRRHR